MEISKELTVEEWGKFTAQFDAMLLYLYGNDCGVCTTLRPKISDLINQKFPNIKMVTLNAQQYTMLAAQIRVLSIPGIVLYIDGKEALRANGLISLGEFEERISRLYQLRFD